MCEFDADDEEAAFAYAEERARATDRRLPVTNRSCDVVLAMNEALRHSDVDGIMRHCSDRTAFDDRRRFSGYPILGADEFRAAFERLCAQYNRSEVRFLAVRGGTLNLHWSRWSDDAGNESVQLHVVEISQDGLIASESRFDERDFDAAYRELERRYLAGEGEEFAAAGAVQTEWIIALNTRDYERLFDELTDPEMTFQIRSTSPFPDRSATQLRTSLEEWTSWIASMRTWHSASQWVSPTCCISRNEREGLGRDGEHYSWTRIYVFDVQDGRCAGLCEFELDDEAAAFAYAEERAHRPDPR